MTKREALKVIDAEKCLAQIGVTMDGEFILMISTDSWKNIHAKLLKAGIKENRYAPWFDVGRTKVYVKDLGMVLRYAPNPLHVPGS